MPWPCACQARLCLGLRCWGGQSGASGGLPSIKLLQRSLAGSSMTSPLLRRELERLWVLGAGEYCSTCHEAIRAPHSVLLVVHHSVWYPLHARLMAWFKRKRTSSRATVRVAFE